MFISVYIVSSQKSSPRKHISYLLTSDVHVGIKNQFYYRAFIILSQVYKNYTKYFHSGSFHSSCSNLAPRTIYITSLIFHILNARHLFIFYETFVKSGLSIIDTLVNFVEWSTISIDNSVIHTGLAFVYH